MRRLICCAVLLLPAPALAAVPSESDQNPPSVVVDNNASSDDAPSGAASGVDAALPAAPAAVPWRRRLEVGGDFAYVDRPSGDAFGSSAIRYAPAAAWGVHLRWNVTPWLRFHPYFLHAVHQVEVPAGALTSGTEKSISASASLDPFSTETFVFGAQLAPTWALSDRARAWLSVGVGWGRFQIPRLTVTESNGATFEVRSRSAVFVEIPVGLGIAYDVIPRWLSLSYGLSAAPALGQSGEAHELFQAVDADGQTRDVAPLPAIEAAFVQIWGLSLIL